jgi:hypothetical protein
VWIACAAALLAAGPAAASQRLGDVNVHDPTLAVNIKGEALITYTRESGEVRHVLAWGAINARKPNPVLPQIRFEADNSGGWKKYRRLVWKTFRNACRPYDGPELVWMVAGCKAPDGSYWALQSWQRIQPMRGFAAFKPAHMKYELHLSHWTGPLAELEVSPNWTYGGHWQGIFGRLTYLGRPSYGFRTPSSTRRDPYARFFYFDTLNSAFGSGWKHDTGIVAHSRNGAFCYSFVPQATPPGYPVHELRPPGTGERHRVTVMGPGVTPVLQWEGKALGAYDPKQDAVFNTLFDRLVGPDDRVCIPER